jgi:hypothetical protein
VRKSKKLKRRISARTRLAQLTTARRADQRGRDVPPTPGAYEAIAELSHTRVAEALIARHNLRMAGITEFPGWLSYAALSPLAPMPILDQALQPLVPDPARLPSGIGQSWPEHLSWGVDSGVSVVRLLLCGQLVGAAAIARNQLERWTTHRAWLAQIPRKSDERSEDFIARVWSVPIDRTTLPDAPLVAAAFESDSSTALRHPDADHAHARFSAGLEVCPAQTWIALSEIIHGRLFTEAIAWDSRDCLGQGRAGSEVELAFSVITDAVRLSVSDVRKVLAAIHLEHGSRNLAARLCEVSDGFSERGDDTCRTEIPVIPVLVRESGLSCPPLHTLMPLLPAEGLRPAIEASVSRWGRKYDSVLRGERPDGRLYRDDELVTLGFAWHRAASIRSAVAALKAEKRLMATRFDLDVLNDRAARWVFVSEALALCGAWALLPQQRAAACTAASALRSACWLWLEDDDRAMAVTRSVLEQTARLRTWRIKPGRAAKLEERAAPPTRWLEAAGWRRLGPLNLALSEFSHLVERSDWERGRRILGDIQVEANPETATFTARGNALQLVEELAAREVTANLTVLAPNTATAFQRILSDVGLDIEDDALIESRLSEIWKFAPGAPATNASH